MPNSIKYFERLSITVLVVNLLVAFSSGGSILEAYPKESGIFMPLPLFLIYGIVGYLLFILYISRRASNLARWTDAIICIPGAVLATVFYVPKLIVEFQSADVWDYFSFLIAAVCSCLLFTKESRDWFKRQNLPENVSLRNLGAADPSQTMKYVKFSIVWVSLALIGIIPSVVARAIQGSVDFYPAVLFLFLSTILAFFTTLYIVQPISKYLFTDFLENQEREWSSIITVKKLRHALVGMSGILFCWSIYESFYISATLPILNLIYFLNRTKSGDEFAYHWIKAKIKALN